MMNRITAHPLAFLLLLTLALSCKEQVQLPIEPAPNLATCRIAKEVYWNGWRPGANAKKEIVKAAGKSYEVMLARETTYSYDEQGRIVKEDHKMAPFEARSTSVTNHTISYTYTPQAVYVLYSYQTKTYGDTIPLNEQGWRSREYERLFSYDAQGYEINSVDKTGRVLTQNFYDASMNLTVVKDSYSWRGATYTYTYAYDLTRPNIPNKYFFYGRISPNLPVYFEFANDSNLEFPLGELVELKSFYSFDQYNRVSRQIAVETHKYPDPYYGQYMHSGGIGVTDYTYECP
ncbi:hypothetical protein [Spirosoma montaniterrae]|uniref:DUF4595 domain-containing protein n=1 Tax=Spirosoma montaniterrae TaxID=1178516 RepID=A0A1P9WSY7_9BACT|nr:hypothetical protein [Spirosoma montaniterrae]AQG78477.1 hypothetical protein AWR27_03455 [Spirosoma montaniterrae]